ncbi:hypothetical protein [Burkholderia cepacia]|uniref:hypothetical protein n=1 Tax=Burkholderia cepacia TaxID=292 RepID=UPI0015894992|nr:hypothetical protein [Burkholderia cepacia]
MSVAEIVDAFQGKLVGLRRELFVSGAIVNIGIGALTHPENRPRSVTLRLDANTFSEPYPVDELVQHTGNLNTVVFELFQGKMISAWHDLLGDLYGFLIREHFDGRRNFPEAKKIRPEISLDASEPLQEQVLRSAVDNFAFLEYSERIKQLNQALNPTGAAGTQAALIQKHVHIRNAVQHHDSRVNDHMLRRLARHEILLLDDGGTEREFALNDPLVLSIPEIESLHRALWLLTNTWRNHGV